MAAPTRTKEPSAKNQGAKPRSAKSPSTKCLELPETGHTDEVADIEVEVDTEAPGGKTPNSDRVLAVTYLLLAPGVGMWTIPKEPFPRTDIMHQNRGRCL